VVKGHAHVGLVLAPIDEDAGLGIVKKLLVFVHVMVGRMDPKEAVAQCVVFDPELGHSSIDRGCEAGLEEETACWTWVSGSFSCKPSFYLLRDQPCGKCEATVR
jgi:hypothetical protein